MPKKYKTFVIKYTVTVGLDERQMAGLDLMGWPTRTAAVRRAVDYYLEKCLPQSGLPDDPESALPPEPEPETIPDWLV